MTKRFVKTVVLMAILCGGVYWSLRTMVLKAAAMSPITVTAFTLEQITSKGGADRKVIEVRTTARKSDGSKAIVGMFPNDPKKPPMRRIDFANGRAVSIIDTIRSKMSVWRPAQTVASEKAAVANPPNGCLFPTETNLKQVRVLDVDAVVVERKIANGRRMVETRVPLLQCFPIAMTLFESQTSEVVIEVTPAYLKIGDPPGALFDESQSKEMSPSELKKTLYLSMGVTESVCPTCFGVLGDAELDRLYREMSGGL
jgi:hypothetical protein